MSKPVSDFLLTIISLKKADEYLASFQRSSPDSKGARTFQVYRDKIKWIYDSIRLNPLLAVDISAEIKKEWESDSFCLDAITEKSAKLPPEARLIVEDILDQLLKGETIIVDTV